MPANYLDEHQFAQFGEHAFASGALVGRFHHRHADELAKPALIATLRDAGLDDRWQIVEERIERLSVAGKEAADEPAEVGPSPPRLMKKGSWQPGKASWALGASGSARMPGPLDKTCWSPLVTTMTSPDSIAIGSSPMRLVKQRPSVTT